MIEFPIKELDRDEDREILEILRDRRKSICEFLLKIMNSFKIIDVRMNIFISIELFHRW